MKVAWIYPIFAAFSFSLNGLAEEGAPCHESPQSVPSESPASGPSTGPSTAPSGPAGGEPASVKDQMGLTLNPGSTGSGGGNASDPGLMGGGSGGNDKDINEKIREAAWEKNSGLEHAKEQLNKSFDHLSDAQKKEAKANDKYDKVIGNYADWDREKFNAETRQKNAEVGSKEWYDMIEKNMQLDKQKPALDKARQEAWNQVQDARKNTQQSWGEVRANQNRLNAARDQYQEMKDHYQAARATQNAPIPKLPDKIQ